MPSDEFRDWVDTVICETMERLAVPLDKESRVYKSTLWSVLESGEKGDRQSIKDAIEEMVRSRLRIV